MSDYLVILVGDPPPRMRRYDAEQLARELRAQAEVKERTRRNVELWAACIAGAIPRRSYIETIEAAGFRVEEARTKET